MRVDVKKFLFIGSRTRKSIFFAAAQKVGTIEFFKPEEKTLPLSSATQNLAHAIKILREYLQEEQELKKDIELAEQIASKVVFLKDTLEKAEEQKKMILQEITRIQPFGDFSIDTIRFLQQETAHKARFFFAKQNKHLEAACPSLVLVNSEEGVDYFFAFADDQFSHPDAIEVRIEQSLDELRTLFSNLEQTIQKSTRELKGLTRYSLLLHHAFIHHINHTNLTYAQENAAFHLDDHLFVIEGWVPENKVDKLKLFAQEHGIYAEEVAVESVEIPPTYLENEKVARVGEDLISIFDTPSNQDKDPSIWVLGAFSLFFAMIINDAGYGIIFLLTALFLKYKLKKISLIGGRLITLMGILGAACLIWGGLANSFFGISLSRDNPLRAHSLMTWLVQKKAAYHIAEQDDVFEQWQKKYPGINSNDTVEQFLYPASFKNKEQSPIVDKLSDNILLELALFVGSIHIICGLLRYLGKNPANAGWIAFIIGAYLYLPTHVNATSMAQFVFGISKAQSASFGLQLLFVGIGFAVFMSIIRHGITGIFEIMSCIQIFADVLSYLRIYALGLAGSIVATLVNEVSTQVPLILAIFVIVACHGLNIVISVMGGTIHGLRLNFLEWYHYSFEGGGKPFQPLQLYSTK